MPVFGDDPNDLFLANSFQTGDAQNATERELGEVLFAAQAFDALIRRIQGVITTDPSNGRDYAIYLRHQYVIGPKVYAMVEDRLRRRPVALTITPTVFIGVPPIIARADDLKTTLLQGLAELGS